MIDYLGLVVKLMHWLGMIDGLVGIGWVDSRLALTLVDQGCSKLPTH